MTYEEFQLTRLMRGVTVLRDASPDDLLFQLTRLMRGVTLRGAGMTRGQVHFNSHASCEA